MSGSSSYNFTYTVIVPTTAGNSASGSFGFSTGTSPTTGVGPASGDVNFALTGFTGDFDNSPIVSASGTLGTGPDFVDGVDAAGVTFTTMAGESVLLYMNIQGALAIKATGPTPINAPVSAETYNTTAPACFLRGTLILTDHGDVPVETLAIGDVLVTALGHHRPIRWIGRRSYAGRFLAANEGIHPVRFHAGSLGAALPQRDLLVSPEHAMFLDGMLIPARSLVNGVTIVQERGLAKVDYFHVELDTHDVLLAEGAPSESFLDDNGRGVFHNAHEHMALYPNALAAGERCAPLVESGAELEAVRNRLAELVGQIAFAA